MADPAQKMREVAARLRAAMLPAARAGAAVIRDAVAANAPVATGQTRRDVYVSTPREQPTNGAVAVVKIRRRSFAWTFAEFGSSHQPARPFIRPAAEGAAPEAANAAVAVLRDALKG